MKRSLITTLVIAVVVAIIVGVLHATKAIAGFESGVGHLVSNYAGATRVVGEKWQYVLFLLIAGGVVWLSLRNPPPAGRKRNYLLFGSFLVELLVLSSVCSLYRVFFQPVPCIFAVVLAAAGAEGWMAFLRRDRSHLVRTIFGQPPFEKGVSFCHHWDNAVRWSGENVRSERCGLRHCQPAWTHE